MPAFEIMVDRRGYAPRTAGCKPADFLTNPAAHRKWHGGSVLPRARGVLETLLRKLAHAVHYCEFLKMVRSAGFAPASPDWHSGILLLNDDRKRSGAEPWSELRATYDNKERTPLPRLVSVAPAGFHWRMFRCLQAHLPRSL